ncbi:MAG: hypothetical protein L3J45_02075 [Flavobacteriaceae bacterium]|nr:hypothetical protein [Flavobacteriaceae bacterium]
MSYNNRECVIQIQKGIELQKENIVEACNCFQEAYKSNPLNKDVYINLGKAYMGVGQYDLSMKSFLTYSHFLILENDSNEFNQELYYSCFEFDNQINAKTFIVNNKDSIVNSKQGILTSSFETKYMMLIEGTNLSKLTTNQDLIADIGICYITKHQDIIRFNNIPESLLINELHFIHGMAFEGSILRTSKFSKMIRNIGLVFLAKNLLTNPKISQNDLIKIYFTDNYNLDDI